MAIVTDDVQLIADFTGDRKKLTQALESLRRKAKSREYGRSLWTHFYAQDDWRVNRALTLNYGLRYEIDGQITDTQNRLSNIELNRFVVTSNNQGNINPLAISLLPLIPVPVVTSKDAGYHRSLQLPNYHHIAPRVGLAWAVSDKTVVRAGWGLFFNQAAYNIQTALTENLPFFFNKSVNKGYRGTLSKGKWVFTLLGVGGREMNVARKSDGSLAYSTLDDSAPLLEVGFLSS